MLTALLRRLTASGFRRGMNGSTPWLIVGVVVTGIRILRHISVADQQVLYRTEVKPGDVFQILSRSKQ
jgi:hypothetical protein